MNSTNTRLKKISLWCLGAVAAVAMLHTRAHATTPQVLDIHVSISSTKDLTVNATFYNFGALAVSSGVVATSSITVTNPSATGIIETYTLLAGNAISDTSGTDWARQNSSSSLTADQYAIAAEFSDSRPANVEASWLSDYMTGSAVAATSQVFGDNSGTGNGLNVNPGVARGLWFRINTPPTVSDPGAHTAQVTLAVQ